MISEKLSEHVVGVRPLQRPLPILHVGVLQGRVWALHLEVPPEWKPGTPIELVSVGEQVQVALAVLRSAVWRALAQATSGLRRKRRRTDKPPHLHRHQSRR